MIDPTPAVVSAQVDLDGLNAHTSLAVSNVRAPQSTEALNVSDPSPTPSSARSPHDAQLSSWSVVSDELALRSDPHTYIPPPVGADMSVEQEQLGSAPQEYPNHAYPYPSHQGVHLTNAPSSTESQPYPQPTTEPTSLHQFLPQYDPYLHLQATSHLPLDFIPLPDTSESTSPAQEHIPSAVFAHLPVGSSHLDRPYPVPSATLTAPLQPSSHVDQLPTPAKGVAGRRLQKRRWILFSLLVVAAVATAVGIVVSGEKNKDKKQNDTKDSADNGSSGNGGISNSSTPKPTGFSPTAGGAALTSSLVVGLTNPTPASTSILAGQTTAPERTTMTPPPQPEPPKPTTTTTTSTQATGDYWTCRNTCDNGYDKCAAPCENEEYFKTCTKDCPDHSPCRTSCEVSSPCYSSCSEEWRRRCTQACPIPHR